MTSPSAKKKRKTSLSSPLEYNDEYIIKSILDDGLLEERKKEAEFELLRKKDLHEFEMKSKNSELSRRDKEIDLERERLAFEKEKFERESNRNDSLTALLEMFVRERNK